MSRHSFYGPDNVNRRFSIDEVPLDGNCLFTSLSKILYGSILESSTIRAECVSHVVSRWTELSVQTEAPDGSNYAGVDVYEMEMSRESTYGGMSELTAAAYRNNIFIVVYELDLPPNVFGDVQRPWVELLYTHDGSRNGHYRPLRRIEDLEFDQVNGNEDMPGTPENADPCEECPIGGAFIVENNNFERQTDNEQNQAGPYIFFDGPGGIRPLALTAEPPHIVIRKQSLELRCKEYVATYMWAGRFQGEKDSHIEVVDILGRQHDCKDCGALFWGAERRVRDCQVPATCCGDRVKVSWTEGGRFRKIEDDDVAQLFTGDSDDAKEFQCNIRAYNRILSVAFPVADYRKISRGHHHTVVVNGAVSFQAHSFPDLNACGLPRNHGQLYMVDVTNESIEQRIAQSTVSGLNPNTVRLLENYLRLKNPLIQQFMYAGEVQKLLDDEAQMSGAPVTDRVFLVVNPRRGGFRDTDRSLFDSEALRSSRPTGNDSVAAVFVGPEPSYNYDMVFYPRDPHGRRPQNYRMRVSCTTLDTMVYPLIHLHNEDSWLKMVIKAKRSRARDDPESESYSDDVADGGTIRAYLAFRLQKRDNDVGVLRRGRGLFLQWLVDGAVRIIDQNLAYARTHQKTLQVCRYEALKNYVESAAAEVGKEPGRIVIMPANEQRSERKLNVAFRDGVRISVEFGPPSLFITFTCNPQWPAIQRELQDMGFLPRDYNFVPDDVTRVYDCMENIFLSDIIYRCVLGRTQAYVTAVEFQKTGLTHTHVALILDPVDRPETPYEVDRILCAEIPSPEEDSELHELVMTLMLHRPCSPDERSSTTTTTTTTSPACRSRTGRCRYGFPQRLRTATAMGRFGPEYRRRPGPRYWHNGFRCWVDNKWVVPYNPRMLRRFRCHINILVCARGLPFKYIYSYMDKMKSGDTAHVTRHQYAIRESTGQHLDWDEIAHFEAMRYIGPCEAVYRIYGKPFGIRSHAVQTLFLHLPNEQLVYYSGSWVNANMGRKSQLMAWFELNAENPDNRTIRGTLYQDIVKTYRFDKKQSRWLQTKKKSCLGRLMHVVPSPANMPLFYIRCLLMHVPGATSFDNLRNVNGQQFDTFREACLSLGLESGVDCHEKALADLVTFASPKQIRYSFAIMLTHCHLLDVQGVWKKFREHMSFDHLNRGDCEQVAFKRSVQKVLNMIQLFGGNAADFRSALTVPDARGKEQIVDETVELQNATVVSENEDEDEQRPIETTRSVCYESLNDEQKVVYRKVIDSIMNSTDENRQRLFIMTGGAGTGKTYIYLAIAQECERLGVKVSASAFTAIAAGLFPKGDTCHYTFGLPTNPEVKLSYLERTSPRGKVLEACGFVFIDEISMLAAHQMEMINKCLQLMDGCDTPMGRKVVLLSGDMRQILPVFKGMSVEQVVDKTLPKWELWPLFEHVKLNQNMRAAEDPEYAQWVLKVGDGTANEGVFSQDLLIPDNLLLACTSRNVEEQAEALIDKVFGKKPSEMVLRENIILAPTNAVVDDMNMRILARFPAEVASRLYFSKTNLVEDGIRRDEGELHHDFDIAQEELDKMSPGNLPPHKLELKVGCIVMLIRNLSRSEKLSNGTRLKVCSLHEQWAGVKKIDEEQSQEFYLPKMSMRSDEVPVHGTVDRFQLPIRVAHAMTINKSQGQTIKIVGLMLLKPCFTHGQMYVAKCEDFNDSDVESYMSQVLIPQMGDSNSLETADPHEAQVSTPVASTSHAPKKIRRSTEYGFASSEEEWELMMDHGAERDEVSCLNIKEDDASEIISVASSEDVRGCQGSCDGLSDDIIETLSIASSTKSRSKIADDSDYIVSDEDSDCDTGKHIEKSSIVVSCTPQASEDLESSDDSLQCGQPMPPEKVANNYIFNDAEGLNLDDSVQRTKAINDATHTDACSRNKKRKSSSFDILEESSNASSSKSRSKIADDIDDIVSDDDSDDENSKHIETSSIVVSCTPQDDPSEDDAAGLNLNDSVQRTKPINDAMHTDACARNKKRKGSSQTCGVKPTVTGPCDMFQSVKMSKVNCSMSLPDVLHRLKCASVVHNTCCDRLLSYYKSSGEGKSCENSKREAVDKPAEFASDSQCKKEVRIILHNVLTFDIGRMSPPELFTRMTCAHDEIKDCQDVLGSFGFHL